MEISANDVGATNVTDHVAARTTPNSRDRLR
jgi:hypothetical protein